MGYPDYKRDLLDADADVNYILDRYFHSGESHVFVGAAPDEEAKLKTTVARALYGGFRIRVHPFQLITCGSAHLGFSPVPDKLGKPFNFETSDIDISVVSSEIFDLWWAELQAGGLDEATRSMVARDLFFGFINPATVHDVSEHGSTWWRLFGELRTDRAHGIRGRLYRNFWSMQSYHRLAVIWGRQRLQTEAAGQFGQQPAAPYPEPAPGAGSGR